jgi:hypothetical protein
VGSVGIVGAGLIIRGPARINFPLLSESAAPGLMVLFKPEYLHWDTCKLFLCKCRIARLFQGACARVEPLRDLSSGFFLQLPPVVLWLMLVRKARN